MRKYIAYYRVSTKQQGNSGLGLEAQKEAVRSFTDCNNCVVAQYQEIESGKNDNRIELQKAIAHAKTENATLLIAKLDRLSRNAAFIFSLRDSKVDFVCADMPDANTLTIGIMALLAQQERELISSRTKAALARRKAKTGEWRVSMLNDEARQKASETLRRKAAQNPNNRKATAMIKLLREQNMSYKKIAVQLNSAGFKTSTGNSFSAMQVSRLWKRANI